MWNAFSGLLSFCLKKRPQLSLNRFWSGKKFYGVKVKRKNIKNMHLLKALKGVCQWFWFVGKNISWSWICRKNILKNELSSKRFPKCFTYRKKKKNHPEIDAERSAHLDTQWTLPESSIAIYNHFSFLQSTQKGCLRTMTERQRM